MDKRMRLADLARGQPTSNRARLAELMVAPHQTTLSDVGGYRSVMQGYQPGQGWKPEYEREPALEAPMFSPDDLIGSGIGKAVVMPLAALGGLTGVMSKAAGSKTPKLASLLKSQRGMFIGQNAKTWDQAAADKAMQMEASDVDPRVIWKETGTWKGPDGFWRQEIPDDVGMRVNPMKENKPAGWYPQTIGDYANHGDLFGAYPDLRGVKLDTEAVYGVDPFGSAKGAYSHADNTIYMQPAGDQGFSTAVHELQHAIQQREGWARGGSPSLAEYTRLAGEAEARASQARLGMSAKQRREKFPADSYDLPIGSVIVR